MPELVPSQFYPIEKLTDNSILLIKSVRTVSKSISTPSKVYRFIPSQFYSFQKCPNCSESVLIPSNVQDLSKINSYPHQSTWTCFNVVLTPSIVLGLVPNQFCSSKYSKVTKKNYRFDQVPLRSNIIPFANIRHFVIRNIYHSFFLFLTSIIFLGDKCNCFHLQ